MKLRSKIFILVSFCSIIPVFVIGLMGTIKNRQILEQNIGTDSLQFAQMLLQDINDYMYSKYNEVEALSHAFFAEDIGNRSRHGYLSKFLTQIHETSGEYYHICVLDTKGTTIASTNPELINTALPSTDAFQIAMGGKTYASKVTFNAVAKDYGIDIATPIMDSVERDKVIGIISLRLKWDVINKKITRLEIGGQKQTILNHVMLLNSDGLTISCFLPEEMFKTNLISIGVESAEKATNKEEGFLLETSEHGYPSFTAYTYSKKHDDLPCLGWLLLLLQDPNRVFAPVVSLKKMTVFTALTLMVLSIVVAFIFGKKITSPIMAVALAAQALGKEESGQRVQVKSNGEVGILADSFNKMAESIEMSKGQLRETRDYLDNLINYANAPIIVWDADSRITKFNHASEHLTGRNSEEVIGERFSILFPEKSQEQSLIEVKRAVSGNYWETVEIPILHKDGSIRVALWNSANIYAQDGKTLISTVVQGVDITERKQAEQERVQLMRVLESKNEELQSIVYISSHDLKSPLVNINGFSGMLKIHCNELNDVLESEGIDEDMRGEITPLLKEIIGEDLAFIVESAKKMEIMINGLREVSMAGTVSINIIRLDMNDLIKNVIVNLKFKAQEKDVIITTDNLPPCYGDSAQINQLFSNLIDNALNYLDVSRKGFIHISCQIEDEASVYCIEDNGIGIHPDYQNKVFEIYHRLNPIGSIEGSGLGLTIAKRIIDRHNGQIWIESTPEKGSKFFVSLPGEFKGPGRYPLRGVHLTV